MSEKYFEYNESGVGTGSPVTPDDWQVTKVTHLIPILVYCNLGTGKRVLTAHVDYASQAIYFDDDAAELGGEVGMQKLKAAVLDFLKIRHRQYPVNIPVPPAEALEEFERQQQLKGGRYAAKGEANARTS